MKKTFLDHLWQFEGKVWMLFIDAVILNVI